MGVSFLVSISTYDATGGVVDHLHKAYLMLEDSWNLVMYIN